jgi:hypothetical protein
VTFAVTAQDNSGHPLEANCSRASGDSFPIGLTEVWLLPRPV